MTNDLPPHDLVAEQAVLGAILQSQAAFEDAIALIGGRDFYRPSNAVIYETVMRLNMAGTPVDHITVLNALDETGDLSRVGGGPYLHTCIATCQAPQTAAHYARIVAEKSKLRRLLAAGQRILQLGRHGATGGDVDEVIEQARQEIDLVVQQSAMSTKDVDLGTALAEFLDELDSPAPPVVPTGLYDLDDKLSGGLYPGQLVVIGARPGIGKSVLGFRWAVNVARRGVGVLFASLEMSRSDCMARLVAGEGEIELTRVVRRQLTQDDWRRASQVMNRATEWPLHIDDRGTQTVTTIRSKARDITRTDAGLGLIVVDYLQLMTTGKRHERRDLEIGEFTRGLKLLAKELDVPVVALSQLNRGSEHRMDKRPTMTDLRESGSIEQDADNVLLLHRDPENPTEIEAILAKHRQGPTGSIDLRWRGHYARIDSIATGHLRAV